MKKIIVLLVLFTFFLSLSIIKAQVTETFLLGKVIYIDPGHGGLDPGAMYKDLKESTLTLEISNNLQTKLEQLGCIVYMTRYGDYDLSVNNAQNRKRSDLSRRANVINKSNADLYLSIHLNANVSSTWKGAQVYYSDVNKDNIVIAKLLQDNFKKNLNTRRNIKKTEDMYMYKRINIPGVLVEVGFISNPNERYLLKSKAYQSKITDNIVESVKSYFK